MKKIAFLIIILCATLVSRGQFSRAELQASGLTCSLCSKAINKALESLPFVESVKADIKTSSFAIVFRAAAAADVDPDRIRKEVEDAGFFVASLKMTGQFKAVKVENDSHLDIGGKSFHFLSVKPQVLDGEATVTMVDRNFIPAKLYKKYSAATSMECIKTGKAGSCCTSSGIQAGTRVYHVTI